MQDFIKKRGDVTISYNTKVVLSGSYCSIKHYGRTFYKIQEGYEDVSYVPSSGTGRVSQEDSKYKTLRSDNLTRTRNTLIEYAIANKSLWHSFITLTFKENIKDIDEAYKYFNTWRTNLSKKFRFSYLCVPEFQKRGSVHFHMLTSLVCGTDIPMKSPIKIKSDGVYRELVYYDLPHWKYGFSSAFDINMTDSAFNVALYVTKYLYKDIDNRLFGRNKILKSNDLLKPDIILLQDDSKYQHAMEYVKKYDSTYEKFSFCDFVGSVHHVNNFHLTDEDINNLHDILL